MQRQIVIPRKFDFRYSPLGVFIRRIVKDRLRAEAYHLLTILLGFVVVAFVQFLAWATFNETITADPLGSAAIVFFATQLIALSIFVYIAFAGLSQEFRIVVSSYGIVVDSSAETIIDCPWERVVEVRQIQADLYQKHYRKYESTRIVGSPQNDIVVLVSTTDGPIILSPTEKQLPVLVAQVKALRTYPVSRTDVEQVSV